MILLNTPSKSTECEKQSIISDLYYLYLFSDLCYVLRYHLSSPFTAFHYF